MIATTFTNRLLVDAIIEYKYNSTNGEFVLKITTDEHHKIIGNVKIDITNCQNITAKKQKNDVNIVSNYLNDTKVFNAITQNTLEFTENLYESGIVEALEYKEIQNNGSPITLTVNNLYIDINRPTNLLIQLLDTSLSVVDDARITFQERSVINLNTISYNGILDEYALLDNVLDYEYVNNKILSFKSDVRISLANVGELTNIPIVFYKLI